MSTFTLEIAPLVGAGKLSTTLSLLVDGADLRARTNERASGSRATRATTACRGRIINCRLGIRKGRASRGLSGPATLSQASFC